MLLELRKVSLAFHRGTPTQVVALRRISLAVAEGEFITVVGSNGAGKTSLNNIISGAVRPTAGRVLMDGKDVTRLPDYQRASRVARVFDDPLRGTAAAMSVEENLALAMARSHWRFRRALSDGRRRRMQEALTPLGLGLEMRLKDPVRLLSAGQRQSLTMVMASLCDPEILLLDEHVAALDPRTQKRVLDITIALVGRLGCAAIMVTHNMAHAISLGDRLLVMSRGEIVGDFAAEDKQGLTVASLVEHIERAGGIASDRMVLSQAETVKPSANTQSPPA
jgi:putative ABC transport system ATP-binding protein